MKVIINNTAFMMQDLHTFPYFRITNRIISTTFSLHYSSSILVSLFLNLEFV